MSDLAGVRERVRVVDVQTPVPDGWIGFYLRDALDRPYPVHIEIDRNCKICYGRGKVRETKSGAEQICACVEGAIRVWRKHGPLQLGGALAVAPGAPRSVAQIDHSEARLVQARNKVAQLEAGKVNALEAKQAEVVTLAAEYAAAKLRGDELQETIDQAAGTIAEYHRQVDGVLEEAARVVGGIRAGITLLDEALAAAIRERESVVAQAALLQQRGESASAEVQKIEEALEGMRTAPARQRLERIEAKSGAGVAKEGE